MNDVRIARITGAFGLACVALTFGQFPLWTIGSAMIWFLTVSVILIRRCGTDRSLMVRARRGREAVRGVVCL